MFGLEHYPVTTEYEHLGDVTNPHVVSFQVPEDAMFYLSDVMQSRLKKFALTHDVVLGRVELLPRDVAATFGLQQYGDWLRANVGEMHDAWMLYALDQGISSWVRIRFADKDKAMLFKLTFDNQ
jgi:hypothetical protein